MTVDFGAHLLFNLGSGVLLVALGLAVAAIRPRRRANLAFALFSGALGMRVTLAYAGYMLGPGDAATTGLFRLATACSVVATASVLLLAVWFPRPLARGERRLVLLPAAAAAGWCAAVAWGTLTGFQGYADILASTTGADAGTAAVMATEFVAVSFIVSGFFLLLLLLALRHGAAGPGVGAPDRRWYVLTSAALVLYPGQLAGGFALLPGAFLRTFAAAGLILLAMLAILWLRNAARAGAEAPACRNMALLCLAAPLAGMALIAAQGGIPGMLGPQHAIVRTLSVALFAYAIVRHQLLGIDVRVKRTLRHSTAATVFLGIFLLGSEGARSFLGGALSPYLGVAAAGAMLLAFTRVQRLAESVADRAMPKVQATPAYFDARRLEVYRAALQESLSPQGELPEKQAAVLARLRAELGVSDRDHAVLAHALLAATQPGGEGARVGAEVLGRYRLVERLGEGSFGTAFLAEDAVVGRRVVVKARRVEGQGDATLREARAIATVKHPNVATLFDVERVGREAFIVMEHVEGGNLQQRLRRGPLARQEFRAVARGTLAALDAVHRAGIVHRDVKPSNILLTLEGEPKLADFGVARLPGLGTTRDTGSAAVGTVQYMSPEQAKGLRVTAASDLFSAAATLYEAYTGRPYLQPRPHEGAFRLQMRAARARPFGAPLRGGPALRAWFRQALDPSPERRFLSARAMGEALERALPA